MKCVVFCFSIVYMLRTSRIEIKRSIQKEKKAFRLTHAREFIDVMTANLFLCCHKRHERIFSAFYVKLSVLHTYYIEWLHVMCGWINMIFNQNWNEKKIAIE